MPSALPAQTADAAGAYKNIQSTLCHFLLPDRSYFTNFLPAQQAPIGLAKPLGVSGLEIFENWTKIGPKMDFILVCRTGPPCCTPMHGAAAAFNNTHLQVQGPLLVLLSGPKSLSIF